LKLFGLVAVKNESDIIEEVLSHLRRMASFDCRTQLGGVLERSIGRMDSHRDLAHEELIGEYRSRDGSMSRTYSRTLSCVLQILESHRTHALLRRERRMAFEEGWQFWIDYYGRAFRQTLLIDGSPSPGL
jgi:hypothetical protein